MKSTRKPNLTRLLLSIIFLVCVCGICVSCTTPIRYEYNNKYQDWKICTFPKMGISMELPNKGERADEYLRFDHMSFSVSYHYIGRFPPVDDDLVCVSIFADRIPLQQLDKDIEEYKTSGLYKRGNEENHKRWFWYYSFHPETSLRNGCGAYSYYRRDISINTNEIVMMHVEFLNVGSKESQEIDHTMVRRILDSAKPLLSKQNK